MADMTKEEVEVLTREFKEKYKDDRLRFHSLPGVTTNWKPERLVTLLRYKSDAAGTTQEQVAEELGVDRSSVSRKVNSMDWKSFGETLSKLCSMSKEDALVYESQKHAERALEKQEEKDRKKLITKQSFYQTLQAQILEATKDIRIRSEPVKFSPRTKSISSPEHVVLLLSDMHAGLGFSPQDTGGINSFNKDILAQRAKNLQLGMGSIYTIHRKAYRLPCLHIFCLGDMVQGCNLNGEWGPAYNKEHVVKQAAVAARITAEIIEFSLTLFDKVEFLGVVGNHGRAGVSKNSDAVGANWDNVAFMYLKAKFEDNKRVSIKFDNDTWWASKNVLGTEFVLIHGDNISGSGTLNALKTINQKLQDIVSKQTGKTFNVLCLGHYHTFQETETTTGRILVNGSFVGADMHSLQHMQSGGKATQTIFGVHERHGITWKYNIDLDAERQKGE